MKRGHTLFQFRKPTPAEVQKIFLLFTALNVLGYDEENNRKGMSPMRRKVRTALRGYRWDTKYFSLKREFTTHHPWGLIRAALAPPASSRNSIIANLKKFAREPEVRSLWENYKKHCVGKTCSLASHFAHEAKRIAKFVGKSPRTIKRLVLITNPLDAYWRGYSLLIRGTGYIITGPGAKNHAIELIRHELFHLFAPRFHIPLQFVSLKLHRHIAMQGYSSRSVLAREYVVRGLNLLYEREVLWKNIGGVLAREAKQFSHIRQVLMMLEKKKKPPLEVASASDVRVACPTCSCLRMSRNRGT